MTDDIHPKIQLNIIIQLLYFLLENQTYFVRKKDAAGIVILECTENEINYTSHLLGSKSDSFTITHKCFCTEYTAMTLWHFNEADALQFGTELESVYIFFSETNSRFGNTESLIE